MEQEKYGRHTFALLALLIAGCVSAPDREPAVEKPNIIWIMADDLGWGDVVCYGQKRIRTPRIDRLAAEGMRFTSFYAGSTVCRPSARKTGRLCATESSRRSSSTISGETRAKARTSRRNTRTSSST